jgi:hypothetical protein
MRPTVRNRLYVAGIWLVLGGVALATLSDHTLAIIFFVGVVVNLLLALWARRLSKRS